MQEGMMKWPPRLTYKERKSKTIAIPFTGVIRTSLIDKMFSLRNKNDG